MDLHRIPQIDLDINDPIPIIRLGSDDSNISSDQFAFLNGDKAQQNGTNTKSKVAKNKRKQKNGKGNKHPQEQNLDLPKPSFRLLARQTYMDRRHKNHGWGEDSEKYIHYEEPTAKELDERVEYDMDLADIHWVAEFNKKNGEKYGLSLSENDFEKVMDRLEKESYFKFSNKKSNQSDEDEDAECAICNDGQSHDMNNIIFCEMCDLAVHQECYGVPYVPLGPWVCKRCHLSPTQNVECCLCPNLGGAFKQTEHSNFMPTNKWKNKLKIKLGWAHVICAIWIPEVQFANTVFMEPIEGLEHVHAERWKFKCYICNQRWRGACIQCDKNNCFEAFHVTCAIQAGLHLKIKPQVYEKDGREYSDVKREAFCDKHLPPNEDGRRGGNGMYSGDESDEDLESERYLKKDAKRKKNIEKTRDKLAQKAKEYRKDGPLVKVPSEKLEEMSYLIKVRGKQVYPGTESKMAGKKNPLRMSYVREIYEWWLKKRKARSGVPLIRRLQVSTPKSNSREKLEVDKKSAGAYTKMRFELEMVRMMMGEIRKRERLKHKAITLGTQIGHARLTIFDQERPATED